MRYIQVRYGFELAEDVTIPSGSELRFVGGKITGAHTLTGQNSRIVSPVVAIFGTDIMLAGMWDLTEVYPEWFGANADNYTDSTIAIQKALDFAGTLGNNGVVKLSHGTYLISDTLLLHSNEVHNEYTGITLQGVSRNASIIKASAEMDAMIAGEYTTQTNNNFLCVTLRDFTLNGTCTEVTSGRYVCNARGGIVMNLIYAMMYNIRVQEIDGTAITLSYCYNINLDKIFIFKCNMGLLYKTETDPTAASSVTNSCFYLIKEYGISTSSLSQAISISNNLFEQIGETAIIVLGSGDYVIENNYFEACSGVGLEVRKDDDTAIGTIKAAVFITGWLGGTSVNDGYIKSTGRYYAPKVVFKGNNIQFGSGYPVCMCALAAGEFSQNTMIGDNDIPLIVVPPYTENRISNLVYYNNYYNTTKTLCKKILFTDTFTYTTNPTIFSNVCDLNGIVDDDLVGNLFSKHFRLMTAAILSFNKTGEIYEGQDVYSAGTAANRTLNGTILENIDNALKTKLQNTILCAEYFAHDGTSWSKIPLTIVNGKFSISVPSGYKITLPKAFVLGQLSKDIPVTEPCVEYNYENLASFFNNMFLNSEVKLVGDSSVKSVIPRSGYKEYKALDSIPRMGPNSSKPTSLSANLKGFEYFDTDNNKPIYWNGSGYVDATGSSV